MNLAPAKLPDYLRLDADEGRFAPSLERRRLRTYILMLVLDGILLNFGFSLAGFVWEGRWWEPRSMIAAQAMLPVFFTIAFYNASYGVNALVDWLFASRQVLIALVIAAALINFLGFYTKSNEDFSRGAVTLGLLFTAIFLVAMRRVQAMAI